ncbi:MAG: hypothetical protein Q9207_004930 [Kuettlingeria erythrocarpa]
MGGKYWYFYRLDGEIEEHDPAEPTTTACPLLPGQQVNVLDIPVQRRHEGDQGPYAQTLLDSMVFTLDPNAKYDPPKPSINRDIPREYDKYRPTATVTSLAAAEDRQQSSPARCSTASLKSLQPLKRMRPATSQGPCIGFPKASSLMAVFHKMRGTRSMPSTSKSHEKGRPRAATPRWETEGSNVRVHRTSFTETKASRVRAPLNTPEWPVAAPQNEPVTPWTASSSRAPPAAERHSLDPTSHQSLEQDPQTTSPSRFSEDSFNSSLDSHEVQSLRTIRRSGSASRDRHLHQSSSRPESRNASTSTAAVVAKIDHRDAQEHASPQKLRVEEDCLDAVRRASSPLVLPIQSNAQSKEALPLGTAAAVNSNGLRRATRPPSLLHDDRKTLETFYAASSSCGGQLSPYYLSQPETPSVRDFEEAWGSESQTRAGSQDLSLQSPSRASQPLANHEGHLPALELLQMPQLPSPGFQGYSLPEQNRGSSLTLRKPASATLDTVQPLSNNEQLVHSWNDGSGHPHLTSLDELIDDLGHLGQAIV